MAELGKEKDSIILESLILCEGRDEFNFLVTWLNSKALADEEGFARDIQVMDFGGNQNLPKKLPALRLMEGFDKLRYLMIIRDAEQDAQGAVQSIQGALCKSGLDTPAAPAQWIYDEGELPKPKGIGLLASSATPCANAYRHLRRGRNLHKTLRSLFRRDAHIIRALIPKLKHLGFLARFSNAQPYMNDINAFLDSFAAQHGQFQHMHKTQLHTYFSVSSKYTGKKIGEAATSGAFDWTSTALDPLKNFVRNMINNPNTKE